MASRILSFWSPGVDGRTRPAEPTYTTIATRSLARSWFTSNRIADFTRGQLVRRHHRTRDVEQKHEVRLREILDLDPARLQADADELVLRLPWRGCDLGMDRERVVALGLAVVVREVVHELFDANRVTWRQLA